MNSIELIGYYGSDETHGLSAWTSTSRDLTPEKRVRLPNLITGLGRDGHHTPFEKSALHFLLDSEVASHIHLLKHRIGVSINGESARYKEIKDLRSHVPDDWPEEWRDILAGHTAIGQNLYRRAIQELTPTLGRKRAKESARFFLGYTNTTTVDVMFNFRSFMHFQKLRNHAHAQREIREIAQKMLELTRDLEVFNNSLRAFGY